MTTLYFDCETYSECDLFKAGTHAYAEDESTEITVAQWALDEGEPVVEDLTGRQAPSAELVAHLLDDDVEIVAHFSHFDRTLIRHCWGLDVPPNRWRDTGVKALAHGLPGGLDKVGAVLKLGSDQAKDKRGKELIQLLCKPRPKNHTLRRATRETHPVEWADFVQYSHRDIVAMRAIDRGLPQWNYRPGHPELALWHLDQRINDRGFAVDVDLAHAAIAAVKEAQAGLKDDIIEATDGVLTSASRRDQMLVYILAEYGVSLPDMRADTLRRRMEDPELPDAVKLLLAIRLESTKTSTAKYNSLVRAVSADGRLRNTMQFAGAQRTARWAGRLFQPQNMPRPDMEADDIDLGIRALKAGVADVLGDVMRLTANAVRGCIVAPPGKKLCIADLANIEGRGLAYLAGERWKLKAFAEFDQGIGADLYKLAYARAFNVSPDDVGKFERQQGKVMELGCFAGDTPVVTHAGVKAIMAVLPTDRLWDGEQWVAHDGVIAKGVRGVVNVAGIEVTPDHLIKTGATWTPAQALVSSESTLYHALATALANSPSWLVDASDVARATWMWRKCSAPVAPTPTPCSPTTCARGSAPGAIPAQKSKRPTGARPTGGMLTLFPTTNTEPACSTGSVLASTGATTQKTRATRTTGGGASWCLSLGVRIAALFSRIWSVLPGGTPRHSNSTAAKSTGGTNPAIYVSSPKETTKQTDAQYANCSNESTNSKHTFDILNAGPLNRFMILSEKGPLLVHNCGYGGGVAAFITFAVVYRMDLDALADAVHVSAPAEWLEKATEMLAWFKKKRLSTVGLSDHVWTACEALVLMWRAAHPNTQALWEAADEAVRQAIARPGETFSIGQHLRARVDGAWLRLRLPSGRYLCYTQPEVSPKGDISYMGVDQYTRQWKRVKTYAGKLIENCTQAFARDIMAANMADVERNGYEIVLSVHDELLTETNDDVAWSAEHLAEIMTHVPPWAAGIPLAAAGFETTRYRKD